MSMASFSFHRIDLTATVGAQTNKLVLVPASTRGQMYTCAPVSARLLGILPAGDTVHKDVNSYQSWPTTNSAQNMVPCASQYRGHTNLQRSAVQCSQDSPGAARCFPSTRAGGWVACCPEEAGQGFSPAIKGKGARC